MKKPISGLTFLLSLAVVPVTAWAQGSAPNPGKVGVININEAIAATAEGKKAFAEVNKKFQPRQQELQRQQQEIQALQDQLQRQANTLSDEERVRLSRELEEKQKLFKRTQEDVSSSYQEETQDVGRRIYQKMARLITEHAQGNGFSLIVDDAQLPVHYVAKEIDITGDIVKKYDAANPVETEGATIENPTAPPKGGTTTPPKPIVNPKPPATKPKP